MAEIVYLLCAATSIVCAVLLFKGYRETRTGLLFWSALCFAGLAVNNVLLFVDLVVTGPMINLQIPRSAVALGAMMILLYGLIWERR